MQYDLELNFNIPLESADTPLIDFLAEKFTYKSHKEWLFMIESGKIFVDGNRAIADYNLTGGNKLTFVVKGYKEPDLDCDYKVAFENDNIIAVSKPADLPVSSNHRFFKQNMTALLRQDLKLPQMNPIHRLDRETSGLMIYLKKSFDKPNKLRKDPRLIIEGKYYLTIVKGKIEKEIFNVDIPLKDAGCSPISYKVVKAEPTDGKTASTDFYKLSGNEYETLLLAKLNSGRKHQIRVHCALSGFPIVGDKLYLFDSKYFIKRLQEDCLSEDDYKALGARHHLLHAYALKLNLPQEGNILLKSEYFSEEFKRHLSNFSNWQEKASLYIA